MKKYVLMLIMTISLLLPSAKVKAETYVPSGIDSQELEQAVDDYVEEHQETTAAMSVAVFDNSRMIFEKSYGYIDLENKIAPDDNTVYEFASITKLFTWVSLMQLEEKGLIDLDADIREYLPEGFLTRLRYDKPITVTNLMNHNAGWQDSIVEVNILDTKDLRSLDEMLRVLEPPQVYEPGEVVAYSNYGAGVAGYIVECVTGMKFYEYVRENIFQPLGMEHTALAPDGSDNPWVMEQRRKEQAYTVDKELLCPNICYDSRYPDGGIVGTMGDMVLFTQALMTPEGEECPLFEKRETLTEMLSPSLFYGDGEEPYICHGFWSEAATGSGVIGHGGNSYGFSSYLYLDVNNGIGTVISTNQSSEAVYCYGLGKIIYGGMEQTQADPDCRFEDYYYMARTTKEGGLKLYSFMKTFHVTAEQDGGVTLTSPMGGGTIRWQDDDRFILPLQGYDFLCHAVKDETGTVSRIQMMSMEFLPVSGTVVAVQYLVIGGAAVSLLYCCIRVLLSIGATLFRRFAGKPCRFQKCRIIPFCMNMLTVAFFADLVKYIMILLPGSALLSQVKFHGILYMGYLAGACGYLLWLLFAAGKQELGKKEKISCFLTALAALFVSVFIIYWQIFMWWVV